MYRFHKIALSFLLLFGFLAVHGQEVSLSVQQGHQDAIFRIAVSSDGSSFATYGIDQKLVIWDEHTNNQMAFTYVAGPLYQLRYSEDNKGIFVLRTERSFKLDIASMGIEYISDDEAYNLLQYGAINVGDNKLSFEEAKIQLRDPLGHKLKTRTTDYFDQGFTSALYSASQKEIVAGAKDGLIYVYDEDLNLKIQLRGHNADVNDLALSQDGQFLYSVSSDRSIIKWNLQNRKIDTRYAGKSFPTYGLSLDPAGLQIMFGNEIGSLQRVEFNAQKPAYESEKVFFHSLSHSLQLADSAYIYAGEDNKLIINRAGKLTRIKNSRSFKAFIHSIFTKGFGFYQEPFSFYKDIKLSPNKRWLALSKKAELNITGITKSLLAPDYIRIYDLNGKKVIKSRKLYTKGFTIEPNLHFINDSTLLAHYPGESVMAFVIRGQDLHQLYTQELLKTSLPSTRICKFNETSILYHENKKLVIYDLYSGREWVQDLDDVQDLYFLKNGLGLLVDEDNSFKTVALKNETLELSGNFTGHQDQITAASYDALRNKIWTSSKDGSVKVWSEHAQELILSIVPVGKQDCIYITPDNYYMTNTASLDHFGFKKGADFFLPEQFDPIFNRPDIVMQRLGYADDMLLEAYHHAYLKRIKKLGFTPDMLRTDLHLPEFEIFRENNASHAGASMEVRFEAKDSLYMLDRVNVWVNDVAVFGTRGISLRQLKVHEYSTKIQVPLAKGINRVQMSVMNSAGAESYRESFEVESYVGKALSDLYVLSIGVSEYQDSRFNLTYAAKDARDVAETFKESKYYDNINVKVLDNESVTKESIIEVREFLADADINDVVIVFIAGHGLLDDSLDYYYASHDMDFEDPAKRGINYQLIEDLLDKIKPLKKMLFMDTCHSGEVDEDDFNRYSMIRNEQEEEKVKKRGVAIMELNENNKAMGVTNTSELMRSLFLDLRKGTGATVISAAGGMEYALESKKWQNGLFTYCMLNGLQNGEADLNRDGEIWLSEIQKYVFEKVSELSDGAQQPTSRIENKLLDYRVW
ncbi:hypothetical protein GYB22_03695 [bacterium]|nr:hypothetical protein [bacterium]